MEFIIWSITILFDAVCVTFVVKEATRRKKDRSNEIEAHSNIKLAIFICVLGEIHLSGWVLAIFSDIFSNADSINSMGVCSICIAYFVVGFFISSYKIIIRKQTGDITIYHLFFKKTFHVKEITTIRHTTCMTWIAYSNKKKLFYINDKRHQYPPDFYIYILKHSECQEIRPKGYVSRPIE